MTDALPADRLATFEDAAVALARAAGAAILPLFRERLEVADKAGEGRGYDPVTAADKGAETAMRRVIAERFPDHGCIGEEHGEDRPDAEFVWVLDPVDGTRAFIAGLPLWVTLIALRWRGRPVVGAIGQSYLDELYVGTRLGSRLLQGGTGVTLQCRPCPRLTEAVIATTDPFLFNGAEAGAWNQVRQAARLARYGCDGYAFARLAAGTLDLVAEAGLRSWDIEAAIPLIEGAGGLVTDWAGAEVGPDIHARGGRVLAAGDRACHEEALVAFRRSARS
ncbi:MAG: histidinol-phosphatase [Caulobacteraceae bacterium]|nr:histidinol-phosphatase [Caulobacter sp.]